MTRSRGPTFDSARASALAALRAAGWTVKSDLKVPHATSPDGNLRLWFKAQAVHYTKGQGHNLGDAHTLGYDFDLRQYDGEHFVKYVNENFR